MAGNPIKTGKYVSKKGLTREITAKLKTPYLNAQLNTLVTHVGS